MFGFIKKIFIELLASVVSTSSNTKSVFLNNQKCTTEPTNINLHPNEYTKGLCYYLLAVNLDRFVGSYTLNDLSNKVCVPNKTEYLNLIEFNMITGKNESKALTKHISRECNCKFDGGKSNSNQMWNSDKCQYECKNPKKHRVCKKGYILNPATRSCGNGKYSAIFINDSVITCDEITEVTNTVKTNFNEKNAICKIKHFYILLGF